ncbi:MAG: hypothetical protein WAM92_15445, partial [Mycobacterium sp.]
MVDVDPVLCVGRNFTLIESGVRPSDERPRLRIRCGFTSEIARFELLERCVNVVRIEHDPCQDPPVGIGFDDIDDIGMEGLGAFVAAPRLGTTEHEILATGRNGVRRNAFHADIQNPGDFLRHGISAAPYAGIDYPTTIVVAN